MHAYTHGQHAPASRRSPAKSVLIQGFFLIVAAIACAGQSAAQQIAGSSGNSFGGGNAGCEPNFYRNSRAGCRPCLSKDPTAYLTESGGFQCLNAEAGWGFPGCPAFDCGPSPLRLQKIEGRPGKLVQCHDSNNSRVSLLLQQKKASLFIGEEGLAGLKCEKYNYDSMRLGGIKPSTKGNLVKAEGRPFRQVTFQDTSGVLKKAAGLAVFFTGVVECKGNQGVFNICFRNAIKIC